MGTYLILCYSVPSPRPIPVGANSWSRSYRKQELAPTEDRKGGRELPDVESKNAFLLIQLIEPIEPIKQILSLEQ